MSFTKSLTQWAVKTYVDDTFATPKSELQLLFLDWLACVSVGLASPTTQSLIKSLEEQSTCSKSLDLFSPIDKAMILGFASHCKEMDDSEFTGETHPSAVILSSLMSMATDNTTLDHLLRSAWIGYQSLRPIGRAFNPRHYSAGWHGTGTVGLCASTISASLLQNFNSEKLENALGISATLTSGLQASFGTPSKYLNSGSASSKAVLATRLTQNGMTGPKNIFERKSGFFEMFSCEPEQGDFHFNSATDSSLNWIKIKKYPGCHCLEPIIEAALSVAAQINDLQKIQKISLYLSDYDFNIVNQRSPQTLESVYFSASYVVAFCLLQKKMDFTTPLFNQSLELVNLESRVELIMDKNLNPMECSVEIEGADQLYKKKSQLHRQESTNDIFFVERKFLNLTGLHLKKTDRLQGFKDIFHQKNATVGQLKNLIRESLEISL